MPTLKKPESERFKGPAKYAEYLLARTVVSLLQRLPIRLAYRLGWGIGWVAWKTMKRRRATVRKNLEIVNAWMEERAEGGDALRAEGGDALRAEGGDLRPEFVDSNQVLQSPPTQVSGLRFQPSEAVSGLRFQPSALTRSQPSSELTAQVREVFLRAGANLFAGFTFARMRPGQAEEHIRVAGLEHLKLALAQGKGALILLAHMGPWEALAQLPGLAQKHGIDAPFGAMYRPLNNCYLDDWFKAERERQGTHLFSRRDGFHRPVDFLRSGGMLGILADQKMREGPKVPYFGVVASSSPVAGLFQRRSGAAVLAVSIQTLGPASWQIRVFPVDWPTEIAPKDRAGPARVCNEALEIALAQSPLDGFWLHERFA